MMVVRIVNFFHYSLYFEYYNWIVLIHIKFILQTLEISKEKRITKVKQSQPSHQYSSLMQLNIFKVIRYLR